MVGEGRWKGELGHDRSAVHSVIDGSDRGKRVSRAQRSIRGGIRFAIVPRCVRSLLST